MPERTLVLNDQQVQQKINRISYQLGEALFNEKEIILIGIHMRGYELARLIVAQLEKITDRSIRLGSLQMDKNQPLNQALKLDIPLEELEGQSIVLVDDVLNSGKTLIHAARFLLQEKLEQLITVVLVDRRHRKFPIRADFVGLTLSTTIQEHIAVQFLENGQIEVYLD